MFQLILCFMLFGGHEDAHQTSEEENERNKNGAFVLIRSDDALFASSCYPTHFTPGGPTPNPGALFSTHTHPHARTDADDPPRRYPTGLKGKRKRQPSRPGLEAVPQKNQTRPINPVLDPSMYGGSRQTKTRVYPLLDRGEKKKAQGSLNFLGSSILCM